MPRFLVVAVMPTYATVIIEAADEDEARAIADNTQLDPTDEDPAWQYETYFDGSRIVNVTELPSLEG